jgi:hypothetical protein
MPISAEFCHEQATFHRERAQQSSLINVREVAERASASWTLEAIAAERREERHRVLLSTRAARDAARREGLSTEDLVLSENPGRGPAAEQPSSDWAGTTP